MSPRDPARPPRPWVGALALLLGVALCYLPVRHAGFVWDDDGNVTGNVTLRDGAGLRRIWTDPTANQQYYPLTHTSFWLERRLWGLRPLGYHGVNVALHAASALVLWRTLLLLGVQGAWLAAAIFAIHPVHVESVAWITERKNTLSGVLFLAAALAGVRFLGIAPVPRGDGGGAPPRRDRLRWYVLCAALFVCAVLAKSTASLLPVVLALLLWWKAGRLAPRELLPLAPLVLVGAATGLNTAWLEQHHVGASGEEFAHTLAEKFLIAGRASWFYLDKLLFPAELSFIYPRWRIDAGDVLAYAYPLAALSALAALWALRRRIGRGPLTAALYYGVMLFPALGFFKVYFMRYSFVQDHFQYLASIGPIVLAGAGVATAQAVLAERLPPLRGGPRGLPVAKLLPAATALAILVPLGLITFGRTKVYQDSETLWRDTLAKNPAAWIAHNNLGVILMERREREEAARHFREALAARPDLPATWVNLGDVLLAGGDVPQALRHYRRALELDPGLPAAHVGIGAALDRQGHPAEAEEWFVRALSRDPENRDAAWHLARLRLRAGDAAGATALLDRPLARDPSSARALTLYGEALAAQGRSREAEGRYREAIRLSPDDAGAHLGLGALLASQGRHAEAEAAFSRATSLDPGLAEAHYNLGKVLDLQQRTADAVRHYRLALQADPAFAEAHSNLGVDLLVLGQAAEGIAHLREALRLKPDYHEARINLRMAIETK